MDINMDSNILLSIVNMKLRDFYSNLDLLCDDLDISKSELIDKLSGINYEYSNARNQFV